MSKKQRVPITRRFFAFVLDMFIIDFILFPFHWYFDKFFPEGISPEALFEFVSANISSIVVGIIFYYVVAYFYFVIFEYLLKSTPGKAMFNLEVVSENESFWRYLVRSLQIFFFIPIWLFDIFPIFFNKRKRLLEIFSDTGVKFKSKV